ncbi:hypothetical protein RZS08_19665, partial [Arthrospira platensis SPKY1]|nr:hypothetical protein [Arthrospira platensis SPKY1]
VKPLLLAAADGAAAGAAGARAAGAEAVAQFPRRQSQGGQRSVSGSPHRPCLAALASASSRNSD